MKLSGIISNTTITLFIWVDNSAISSIWSTYWPVFTENNEKKQRAIYLGRLLTEIESVITYIRALNDVNGSTSRPLISVIKRITIDGVGCRVHVIHSVFDWIRFLFWSFCFLPRLPAYGRHWIAPKMRTTCFRTEYVFSYACLQKKATGDLIPLKRCPPKTLSNVFKVRSLLYGSKEREREKRNENCLHQNIWFRINPSIFFSKWKRYVKKTRILDRK